MEKEVNQTITKDSEKKSKKSCIVKKTRTFASKEQ